METQKNATKFTSWNDWESAVNLASLDAPLRKLIDLLLGAAHLRSSQSSDQQHNLFMSLSRRVQSEIDAMLTGKLISKPHLRQ
jgi:competence protein ComGF